jgi:ribose 5-phosphate isomerase B
MQIALGADHAGVTMKGEIARLLERLGHECDDFGTHTEESVDYPDIAERVARSVANGAFDVGILLCGTGVGMSIAANKVAGIRAAAVCDVETARLVREHNDANVLTLGARVLPTARALEIVEVFLATAFAGGRHQRRVSKITAIEQNATHV